MAKLGALNLPGQSVLEHIRPISRVGRLHFRCTGPRQLCRKDKVSEGALLRPPAGFGYNRWNVAGVITFKKRLLCLRNGPISVCFEHPDFQRNIPGVQI
jgi:hypothetical protein